MTVISVHQPDKHAKMSRQLPNDVLEKILSSPDVSCDAKVEFQRELGRPLASKVKIPYGLEAKLNRIMECRRPFATEDRWYVVYTILSSDKCMNFAVLKSNKHAKTTYYFDMYNGPSDRTNYKRVYYKSA